MERLLQTLQQESDEEAQALAAAALAGVHDNGQISTVLRRACGSENSMLAATACDALLERDGKSDSIATRLLELSEAASPETRSMVMVSLRHLDGTDRSDQAVETLTDGLHDVDGSVRSMAALTMGDFAEQDQTVLNLLLERHRMETDERVMQSIEQAVERLGASTGRDRDRITFGVALPFAD